MTCHIGTGKAGADRLIWDMAFLQSQPPRQPVFQAPAIVFGLIGVLAAAHAARLLLPPQRQLLLLNDYAFSPARYSGAFLAAHDIDPGSLWERAAPFVSYMALHNDWTHLGINCLWLLAFGPVVARRFGTPLFLLFFLICGIGGALAYLVFAWGSAEGVIGASGAISGLMAAAIRLMPAQEPWADAAHAPMAPLFSRRVLLFSLIWAMLNLIAGVAGLGLLGPGVQIAWQAHLGGYVVGLVLAGPLDRFRPRPPARDRDLH
jgi:membrane associated rhomboid family serine protease